MSTSRRVSQPTATLSSLGETLRFRRQSANTSAINASKPESSDSTPMTSLEPSPIKLAKPKVNIAHATSLPPEVENKIQRRMSRMVVGAESSAPDGHGHPVPMDSYQWRKRGKEMVDYIAEYMDTIEKRRVTPNVEPGYLGALLPQSAPHKPEDWDTIMADFEKHIMPGMTHWQHPRFHAYFPAGNSYPSILADMLSDGIGCVGFSWAASPACTELEVVMLDWVGKMVGLPSDFLCYGEPKSKGGGVIEVRTCFDIISYLMQRWMGCLITQGSASECVLVCLLAARYAAIKALKLRHPLVEDGVLLSKLMAYCSKESHSCVEKAAMIGFVKLRILDTDDQFRLRGAALAQAIEDDRKAGLEPFFVSSTLGTTSCCSFDAIDEIGPVCQSNGVWLHVDAAYAGNAFVCPEFQYLLKGIEYASSFNTNPNKWMLVNFDCSLLWVRDRFKLTQAMVVDPLYLQHSFSEQSIDYRHWGIPLSRRFRSLKLWFVIRNYGIEGLQNYVRDHCKLAKKFEKLITADQRFEVLNQVILGLVCFRLKGSNHLNQRLLSSINASGKLHMVPASLAGKFVIRFCVCAQQATESDIKIAYETICSFVSDLFEILKLDNKAQKEELDYMKEEDSLKGEREEGKQEGAEKEEDESADEVLVLDRKKKMSLRYKRSFFVRMVSDPKLYNPKIVKALGGQGSSRGNSEDVSDPGVLTPL
ncbi:Tyrosine decarboxylase [Halotydeus destructor]|nr:Tyrosine decarboxylase [Halotydeus destructor]